VLGAGGGGKRIESGKEKGYRAHFRSLLRREEQEGLWRMEPYAKGRQRHFFLSLEEGENRYLRGSEGENFFIHFAKMGKGGGGLLCT